MSRLRMSALPTSFLIIGIKKQLSMLLKEFFHSFGKHRASNMHQPVLGVSLDSLSLVSNTDPSSA